MFILENVGNFEKHDNGLTWLRFSDQLRGAGYELFTTGHKSQGGAGLISPHHLGFAQKRSRFMIVGTRLAFRPVLFPNLTYEPTSGYVFEISASHELTPLEREETKLSDLQLVSVALWDQFASRLKRYELEPPSIPIWTDVFCCDRLDRGVPPWKATLIDRNKRYFADNSRLFPKSWLQKISDLPPSYRKLEWNVRDLAPINSFNLQFRPSGIRVSSRKNFPTLIAMTTSQLPVIAGTSRFVSRREALLLQGFPSTWNLPENRGSAFRAIGNAVHPAVVETLSHEFVGKLS